ncbi:MAG: hypothetical protein ACAI25_16920 [Planctomycetota bacterium]
MRRFLAPAVMAVALATTSAAQAGPEVGKKAPTLGGVEVVQGEPFNDLRDLKGRVIKLVFFATW